MAGFAIIFSNYGSIDQGNIDSGKLKIFSLFFLKTQRVFYTFVYKKAHEI